MIISKNGEVVMYGSRAELMDELEMIVSGIWATDLKIAKGDENLRAKCHEKIMSAVKNGFIRANQEDLKICEVKYGNKELAGGDWRNLKQ